MKVVHSEACELVNGLRDVPLIIADPPYGIGYHSNHYVDRNPHAPVTGDWNMDIGRFCASVSGALADGGALYLFSRWDVLPKWTPYVVRPLRIKTCIVWVKDNWTAGDLSGSFGNQWEAILFIAKGRHRLRGKRWSNVWNFARVPAPNLLHPTEKPVPLLQRMIAASSDEGDLVVDPFCGSGSTGEAAMSLGRRVLLGDVDPTWVRASALRLGLPSDAPAERAFSPSALVADEPDEQCSECGGRGIVRR